MTVASASASARAEGSSSSSSSSKTTSASDRASEMDSQPQPQRPARRRPRRDDFWSREYWEERFSLKPLADENGTSKAAQTQDLPESRGGQRERQRGEGEGETFEWLGAGEELLTRLVEGLERRSQAQSKRGESGKEADSEAEEAGEGPLVLHIGCGSSDVGCRMRSMWEERAHTRKSQQGHWALERIVNLDYAPSSLALTRQQEVQRFGDIKMQHVVADLLSLPSLLAVLPQGFEGKQRSREVLVVDGIYDKSTADAISTGPDVTLLPEGSQEQGGASTSIWSFLNGWTVKAPEEDHQDDLNASLRVRHVTSKKLKDPDEVVLEPVEMLAYNLAAVTRPGGIWAALSYSATRFDFLEKHGLHLLSTSGTQQRARPMRLTSLWQVESKWSVEAPGDGQAKAKKDVHAPEVRHWCFLLRRSGMVPS